MDFPVLAVISEDKNQSADSIVDNIRKLSSNEDVQDLHDCRICIHNIVTKYYETKIALLPTDNFKGLNDAVKNKIEGILIYFDANDRSFLKTLPFYKDFIKDHNIEFSILLCKELTENDNAGITFSCIKSIYNKFDIIELESKPCDDDDDEFSEPFGYDELAIALQVFPKIPNLDTSNKENDENSEDELDVEEEIDKFENLLSQMMQFRPNTENMSREERLSHAQNFAEIFEKLILQDAEEDGSIPTE
ncbi:alpha- and gamma-adaptin-binding protein p34 [Chironomus tepperi]|uniref:alpha- and gamma-adaptin-binding protein p34 n=1 Tax=Chironomus tepperi TaxID=113505 RepID=UPI00391F76CC